MGKWTIAGLYEDYCILVIIAAYFGFFFILVMSTFSNDYAILVSTNDYNEHWVELVAFGIALPGIIRMSLKHFKNGGNTRHPREK